MTQLTLDDLKHIKNKPIRMKFGLKARLLKETGQRQAKGFVSHDFDSYSTTHLVMEAVCKGLGLSLPEISDNLNSRDPEEEIMMMTKLPEKAQAKLEELSSKRKALGRDDWSQNNIVLEFLETFLKECDATK